MDRLEEKLSERLSKKDIMQFVQEQYDGNMGKDLFRLLFHPEKRVSDNAAWVLSHFDKENSVLVGKQNELIEEAMNTQSCSKRRLLLTILCKQPFEKNDLRTDFLDFCESKITSFDEPVGIRSLCVKLAYKQSRAFHELLQELRELLQTVYINSTSAAIKSSCRNVLKEMTEFL